MRGKSVVVEVESCRLCRDVACEVAVANLLEGNGCSASIFKRRDVSQLNWGGLELTGPRQQLLRR